MRPAEPFRRGPEESGVSRQQWVTVRQAGGSNSVVESQPSKLLVAGSIPVSRSILPPRAPEQARVRTSGITTQKLSTKGPILPM